MRLVFFTDNERIRGICTGPVVGLSDAVDFLPFLFPRGEEVGHEDIADVVMHHVEVIKNVGDLRIFRGELRAQLRGQRHKCPFDRWSL